MQQKYGSSRVSQTRKPGSSLSAVRVKETLKEVTIVPSKTCDIESVEKLPEDIYQIPIDFTQGKCSASLVHGRKFIRTSQLVKQ